MFVSYTKTLDVLSRLRDYMSVHAGELLQDSLYEVLGPQEHEQVQNFLNMFQEKMGSASIDGKDIEDLRILDLPFMEALSSLMKEVSDIAKQEIPDFRLPPRPIPEVSENLRGSQLNLNLLV